MKPYSEYSIKRYLMVMPHSWSLVNVEYSFINSTPKLTLTAVEESLRVQTMDRVELFIHLLENSIKIKLNYNCLIAILETI